MTLFRLRCMRCGDLDEMEPTNNWSHGLCGRCELIGWRIHRSDNHGMRFVVWMDRWGKNEDRHPTYKALTAALDAQEATEPGTLALPPSES